MLYEDVDVRLTEEHILTAAATADAATLSALPCILQDLKLEAKCNEGDLWHDASWGWSLSDFINSEYDEELTMLLTSRIRNKLQKYSDIDQSSLVLDYSLLDNVLSIKLRFKTVDGNSVDLLVNASAVEIEVVNS